MDLARVETYTILRAVVGSTAHGLALPGTDDRDEMGVCIEDLREAIGFSSFEQYIYRTAEAREGRHDAPSRAGDLDLTIYSLRKFLRLAMQGNPSVLLLLFVPESQYTVWTPLGAQLQGLAPSIVSRQAGRRFLGYMESQRQRLIGERGQKKCNRPDLEAAYGYDTKYAMHVLRLGYQGVELMTTGRLTLPMSEPVRGFLMDVRRGHVALNHVLQTAGDLERELKDLLLDAPIPAESDREAVESWMLNAYFQQWKGREERFPLHPQIARHGSCG